MIGSPRYHAKRGIPYTFSSFLDDVTGILSPTFLTRAISAT